MSHFLEDVDTENVLVFNKISSGEKAINTFSYLYDDYKVKILHITLPKTNAYVKCYDDQTKWVYFLMTYWMKMDKKSNYEQTCI